MDFVRGTRKKVTELVRRTTPFKTLEQFIFLGRGSSRPRRSLYFLPESWSTELWFALSEPYEYPIRKLVLDQANLSEAWAEVDAVSSGGDVQSNYFANLSSTNPHWEESFASQREAWTESLFAQDPGDFHVVVSALPNGRLKVINGYHRLRVAFLSGQSSIKVILSTGDRVSSECAHVPLSWRILRRISNSKIFRKFETGRGTDAG